MSILARLSWGQMFVDVVLYCCSTLTMDKLLESLISKAKLECEEAHRQLLFAFNGL